MELIQLTPHSLYVCLISCEWNSDNVLLTISVCLVPGEWNSDNGLAPILPPWSPYRHLPPLHREVSHQGMQGIASTFGHTVWFLILARQFVNIFHSKIRKKSVFKNIFLMILCCPSDLEYSMPDYEGYFYSLHLAWECLLLLF